MARYEHLPIYKTAMELTVYLEQVVRNFSRYHKYTLRLRHCVSLSTVFTSASSDGSLC